eukprot:scaffold11571_cov119-Isochrysis_galbana.AAC.14
MPGVRTPPVTVRIIHFAQPQSLQVGVLQQRTQLGLLLTVAHYWIGKLGLSGWVGVRRGSGSLQPGHVSRLDGPQKEVEQPLRNVARVLLGGRVAGRGRLGVPGHARHDR